jgi:hypothetical protein
MIFCRARRIGVHRHGGQMANAHLLQSAAKDEINFVAIGITQEWRVVMCVILRANSRCAIATSCICKPGHVAGVDGVAVSSLKRDMGPVSRLRRLAINGTFKTKEHLG